MSGRPSQIASIFAASLAKTNNADVVLYSDNIIQFKYIKQDSILTIVDNILKAVWGGTNTGLVFNWIIQNNKKYDRIIILSDNQSWLDTFGKVSGSAGTNAMYERFVKETNQNPFVYCIDIQGYGTVDIKYGDKVFHLAGWNEKIFDLIKWMEKGNQLVDYINQIQI
jgi:60 kDa SS-A/Ro ribonucleoprotein